jgi:hypothetical protein
MTKTASKICLFRMSIFGDAFLGSGVPLAGDPITLFQLVPLLGLRTATVLDNCRPMVRDVVKARFIATNCGERRLEIVRCIRDGRERDDDYAEKNSLTLLPGESVEFSIFRSWDAPGEHQLNLAYEARCDDLPFAKLHYPAVTIDVVPPLMPWMSWVRATRPQPQ